MFGEEVNLEDDLGFGRAWDGGDVKDVASGEVVGEVRSICEGFGGDFQEAVSDQPGVVQDIRIALTGSLNCVGELLAVLKAGTVDRPSLIRGLMAASAGMGRAIALTNRKVGDGVNDRRAIVHDVNNLIAAPFGFVSLLLDDLNAGTEVDESQLVEDLSFISAGMEKAIALTGRKLDSAGNLKIERKKVDLSLLIDTLLNYCRSIFGEKIKVDFTGPKQFMIEADESNLFSALLNIVKNAGEALLEQKNNPNPTIEVKLSQVEAIGCRYAKIEVGDNGPGISPEMRKSIFEGKQVTTKGERGHGIGLQSALKVDEAHGGKVILESVSAAELQPGASTGTMFTIMLPLSRREA